MITIYHNPRCSKSRESLEILKNSKEDIQIINYLDETLEVKKLKEIIKLLNIKTIDLIRQNENIWKDNFKDMVLKEDELIEIMIKYPILIERPIVIICNKAVIGRPPSKILNLL